MQMPSNMFNLHILYFLWEASILQDFSYFSSENMINVTINEPEGFWEIRQRSSGGRAERPTPSCSVWPKHTERDPTRQNLPRRHGWGFLSAQRGTKASSSSSSVHLCKTGRSEPAHSTFTLTQTALRKGRNSDQNRVLVRDGSSCPWRQKRRKQNRKAWLVLNCSVCVCVCS